MRDRMANVIRGRLTSSETGAAAGRPLHFIEQIIEDDLRSNKWQGRVHTRFPPEPNGYLHIGHAKSICLNFGLAAKYGGLCNLRFDDTNPTKEEDEYVDSIQEDVRWLGFDWEDRIYYASDYFQQLYQWAVQLIKAGKAYVCDLSADETREYRGTLTQPGRTVLTATAASRRTSICSSACGRASSRTVRERCGPRSTWRHPILNMRDPVMYRILHATHHRSGDQWCIYPMYDFTHGQSDSIERITHSICTLEFENHRPLYDWFCEELGIYHPQQIEFARLNLTYTVMSKRKLLTLVKEGRVSGWDDPRMPTICGLRRRGYTPEAIRSFCERIGVAKFNSTIDMAVLENSLREDLNRRAPRVMAVLRPLKVVIENYPEGQVEEMEAINNPEDPSMGTRQVPFSREIYIEQDDFREDPPNKFFRLAPGREVRLRSAYIIKCVERRQECRRATVVELRCTYDPASRSGTPTANRKVKGTLHWVSAAHAFRAEVRLFDHLFKVMDPDDVAEGEDWHSNLNPDSLEVLRDVLPRTQSRRGQAGRSFSVRTPGLLHRRPRGLPTRPARLQPQRRPARHVGQDREEPEIEEIGTRICCHPYQQRL